MLIKPLSTKAYDRRASGDCGTSGFRDPYRSLMYPGWSMTGCRPLAYKTRRLLNEIGRRGYSACLKKGSVTIVYREKLLSTTLGLDLPKTFIHC